MIFIVCLTFSYFEFDPKIVIIKKEIWKGRDSYSEISLRWTGVPWTTNITYLPCIIPLDSLYLWKVMYRSNRSFNIPPPPRGTPRAFNIFVVSGRREFDYQSLPRVGNLNPMRRGWGIWTVVSISCEISGRFARDELSWQGRGVRQTQTADLQTGR